MLCAATQLVVKVRLGRCSALSFGCMDEPLISVTAVSSVYHVSECRPYSCKARMSPTDACQLLHLLQDHSQGLSQGHTQKCPYLTLGNNMRLV